MNDPVPVTDPLRDDLTGLLGELQFHRARFLFRATSRWREGCRRQVERQEPLSNRCRQLRRTDRAPVVVEPALGILLAADELVAERTDDAC